MYITIDVVAQQPPFIRYASSLHISFSLSVLSKPSSSERGSLKLLCDENKIPDQTVTGGENTHLRLGTFKGVCFKDENQKSQKLVCFKGLLRGWQPALWSPNPLPCQAGVKRTLVGSACSVCPQLLMITCTGLSTSCCPHEPFVACQLVYMYLVRILLRRTHSVLQRSQHLAGGSRCRQQPLFLW